MEKKTVYIVLGCTVFIILVIIIIFSFRPRYGYYQAYRTDYGYDDSDYPDYGTGWMHGSGRGLMRGQRWGYGSMRPPGYRHRGINELEFMSSELNLKDDQSKQIFDLGTNYRLRYFEARGNPEEVNKIEQQHRKEIEKLLTSSQKSIFGKYSRGFDRYGWYAGSPYH